MLIHNNIYYPYIWNIRAMTYKICLLVISNNFEMNMMLVIESIRLLIGKFINITLVLII